jgi:hypothetical protein
MTYDQTYIIAFAPGTSGKFLSNIFWEVLTQQDFDWNLSNYNTAHTAFLSVYSYKNDLDPMTANKNPWQSFEFDTSEKRNLDDKILQQKGTGIFNTHAWPDFEILRTKPTFKHTKLIVITIDPDSLWEIFLNDFFKNYILTLQPNVDHQIKTLPPVWLIGVYNDLFNADITYDDLLVNLTKEKIELLAKYMYETTWALNPNNKLGEISSFACYTNPPLIPDDFKDKTLLINYKDVYTTTDYGVIIAVEKFAKFMTQVWPSPLLRKKAIDKNFFSDSVIKKCKDYVEGREKLINGTYKFYNLM